VTAISQAYPDRIEVRGRDLTGDLMGRIGFTEYFHLLLTGSEPNAEQREFLDVVLVALAEHGLMPSNVAARMTLAADPESLGVVLGGSGNGEQMAANKVSGIRAALCYDDELARLAREHNDAQVISIGARMTTLEQARSMVQVFVSTAFSEDPRHVRRLEMVSTYEADGTLPPLPA